MENEKEKEVSTDLTYKKHINKAELDQKQRKQTPLKQISPLLPMTQKKIHKNQFLNPMSLVQKKPLKKSQIQKHHKKIQSRNVGLFGLGRASVSL